ncbi:MAG: DUF2384 domain-containing protein [Flammeovirgaceae bacterium]|jgi:putative toxin-antitoxin system antitoxin component (TIGR02293 family)|nr:DUF2384 domain-containing protein [Flammeovirgaceae bacterium]
MKRYKKTSGSKSTVNDAEVAYVKKQNVDVTPEVLLSISEGHLTEPLQRVFAFRKGFRKKSFDKLKEYSGLDNNTLAIALAVSAKTIQRVQTFDIVQSEKLYQLATLYAMGLSYFGKEGFSRWMERPLFTLGNRKPIELIDVSEGLELVKAEIIRLQHGVGL